MNKNNEIIKYVKEKNKFVDEIIEKKTNLQKAIDTIGDNEFWGLFPEQLKENFITTDSLNGRENKVENIIINNDDNSKDLWEIVNYIKLKGGFDEKDKDISEFYNLMRQVFAAESETAISSLNRTDAETYNDDQSEDIIYNGFLEAPLLNKKRKREIKKPEVKNDECVDPSPPEEENVSLPSDN